MAYLKVFQPPKCQGEDCNPGSLRLPASHTLMSRHDEVLGYYCEHCAPDANVEANKFEQYQLRYPSIETPKFPDDVL